jgi:recombination protein RecR
MKLPEPIKRVADELAELPGIGPRQAIRLAFHLANTSKEQVKSFAEGVDALRSLKTCPRCFFIHQNADELCDFCSDAHRNQSVIMVLEKETDLVSIENTEKYSGRYFLIGEIPKTGILGDVQEIKIQSLREFIEHDLGGQAQEIILGFNPTAIGNLQSSLVTRELAALAKKVSRLGRGLPTGGEIEFADEETLGASLDRRT